MNTQKKKKLIGERRRMRVRAKMQGTSECPRLSVFRSANHISAQLIDDVKGFTLASACDTELPKKFDAGERTGKIAVAFAVGKKIAEKASDKEIKKVIFDRGGYKYHGRVRAVAEGAREGGLKF
jgi:large subunit ribosomal protein L18